VEQDTYSRMLAVSAGGTIPDKGLYTAKTENGVKLGELDEEFVYESRVGDRFLLGSFAWQIARIQKDTVTVVPAATPGARIPFWKGEIGGRRLKTGLAFGEILRRLTKAEEAGTLLDELYALGMDEGAAKGVLEYARRQIAATGTLPDDRTLIVEHYRDEAGNPQMMVHSIFGRPVIEPLAILAMETAKRQTGMNINYVADDDGFLLFPYEDRLLPERLLQSVSPDTAGAVLEAVLPVTPVYSMAFRYNAARALMMGVKNAGRQPLWVQRMRSAQMLDSLVRSDRHPLVRETKRECLEDYWDVDGVKQILNAIRAGEISVVELQPETPSPMSLTLRRQTEASMLYEYTPTPSGVYVAVEEALNKAQMIDPAPSQLKQVSERTRLPENESQLHTLLMIEGDLVAGELNVPPEWLEALEQRDLAKYIEPGLWIAAEQALEYEAALVKGEAEIRAHILRRL
jgi:ATP-dependent Lhr-like helicase